MKKYEKYKTVDEKWCSALPTHWEFLRLKRVLQERKERNNPIKTDFILSLTAKQGVVPRAEKQGNGGNKPKDDLTKYNIAHSGDLLVNCMNVVSGAAGVSRWDGAISPVYYALYPRNEEINIWYYHYLFRLLTFQRSLLGLGKGILMHESDEGVLTSVRMRIAMDYLNNVMLPIPSRAEQDRIVNFLNWQTSKVIKAIKTIKKHMALINEYKMAAIRKAVLQGINKNIPMVETGIDWIGSIPSNWKTTRVKRHFKITNGGDPSTAGNIPVFGSGTASFKTCGEYKEPPAVLLGRKGSINNPLYIDVRYWNVDTAFDVKPKSSNFNLKYFYYCSQCFDYKFYMTQTAIPSMTQTDYGNIVIPFPSIQEQDAIVRYIDDLCERLDLHISHLTQDLTTLEELNTRIISEAITGQIDVRGIEIPDFEYLEETIDEDVDEEKEVIDDEIVDEEV